jgi:hypothetical protein
VTQAERLARREALRVAVAKLEADLAVLREDEVRLLEGCDHTYADGRLAAAGGQVKICSICGRVLPRREEKLWG